MQSALRPHAPDLGLALALTLAASGPAFAQSFDSGTTEGWTEVTMCYRPGFVAPGDPIALLPCCPGECPSTQECVAGTGCGSFACEPLNPGGYLEAPDVDGTCMVGQVQYFAAPPELLAALAGAEGGTLDFKLQSVGGLAPFAQEDLIVDGAGLRIVRSIAAPASGSWTTYSIPLAAGDWHVTSPAGPLASPAEIAAVLAAAEALFVRSEFQLGPDSGLLDDVAVMPAGRTCPGDLNGSGTVDGADLAILLGAWGGPAGDLDGSGVTNGADLAILLGAWGRC